MHKYVSAGMETETCVLCLVPTTDGQERLLSKGFLARSSHAQRRTQDSVHPEGMREMRDGGLPAVECVPSLCAHSSRNTTREELCALYMSPIEVPSAQPPSTQRAAFCCWRFLLSTTARGRRIPRPLKRRPSAALRA